jgi:spermidine synthase
VGAAFLTSGFTSLVLQVVWFKSLSLLLGSTLHAMSTVVAVFLAGLALGAFLAGKVAARLARPLAGYGLLEIGIGLYALLSLPLLHGLDPVAGWSYARFGAASPLYLLARVGVAALVLLPPTILMGATLPWLVSWATRSGEKFGQSLGLFYGLNTLGAVAGAAGAGFLLVPTLGLSRTSHAVGALALLVGATLAWMGSRAAPSERPLLVEAPPGTKHARKRLAAVLLVGLSGAVALVLEVAWARAMSLIFGSSVYSFSLVLTAYLLGVAVGSLLWGGRLADSKRPWLAFAVLQAALGLGVALGLWLLPALPEYFISVLLVSRENLAAVYLTQAALAGVVALVPCLALGALFPVGARILAGERQAAGEATGLAYAVNTAGTVTGSFLAGFVLLPGIGVQATLVGAAAVAVGLAAYAGWSDPARARSGRPVAAAAPGSAKAAKAHAPRKASAAPGGSALGLPAAALGGLALVFGLLAPPWNKSLFTLGMFRSATAQRGTSRQAVRAETQARLDDEVLLYYREGLHAVISVHTVRSVPTALTLRANGKPDASVGEDTVNQIMVGHVPMLWAPPDAEVCVIGHGSGMSAQAVLSHRPKRLTIVELEPAVLEASRLFDRANESVLDRPEIEVFLEDGRQFLQHSGRSYDVIISQPTNPWVAGVNNLFTEDFYRRVRRALRPRGVFCAWLQGYELSSQAVASLLAALDAVFPESEAFLFGHNLIFVATDAERRVPSDRVLDRTRPGPASAYLSRFGFDEDGFVPAHHAGRIADLLSGLPQVPRNTDDLPYVEYRAPFDLFQAAVLHDRFDPLRLRAPHPMEALRRWTADSLAAEIVTGAVSVMAEKGRFEAARALVAEARDHGIVEGPAAERLVAQVALAERFASGRSLVDAARRGLEQDDLQASARGANQALAISAAHPGANLVAGRIAMREDSLATAQAHLRLTLAGGTRAERCEALINLGIIEMRLGNEAAGRRAFEEAVRTQPGEGVAYVNLARWYAQGGELDSVRAVLERGRQRAVPWLDVDRAYTAFEQGQGF